VSSVLSSTEKPKKWDNIIFFLIILSDSMGLSYASLPQSPSNNFRCSDSASPGRTLREEPRIWASER
jgi:hypothetical protein